jgi:hypothetical protein
MTIHNHTKTTPIEQWQNQPYTVDGLHWEARLWDVADGYPLTPDEADRLAKWVAYIVDI